MQNYFIGIAVLFFGGLLSLLIKNQTLKLKFVTITTILGACFTFFSAAWALLLGSDVAVFNFGPIFQSVRFYLDPLSAFFVIVISVMSSLGVVYANGYLAPYIEKNKDLSAHCVFLPLLISSMLGVVGVQNALLFLVVWELMSLSSFFLVIFEHEKKEVLQAGIKYLVYMHVSVIFIILAFAIASIDAGSLDFSYFKAVLEQGGLSANLVFIFAFIGFGIKAGFVPFHNWLPDAHPAAPSHVSGIMSGVMIKTGIYGILRTLYFIGEPNVQIGYFVLIISVISALYGVLYAIGQHDLKRLLAYHSIENIGIIGIGIGIGMLGLAYNQPAIAILGFAGGILHILNHSIFKELLFLAAGAVYTKTHTRNIEILGGLIKSMPKTALLFLIGSVAICALPPFNGFVSEFLIYFSMLKGLLLDNFSMFIAMIFALSGLALVGTMAILCFTKAFSIVFLGEKRSDEARRAQSEVSGSFLAPMTILALFILLIGVHPALAFAFVAEPVRIFVSNGAMIGNFSETMSILGTVSLVSAGLITVIAILFIIKSIVYKSKNIYVTWGCGYNRPNSRMQYSASSYASPFLSTLKPLFKRVSDIKKPKAIFEHDAHYAQHVEDVEEAYFLKPFITSIEKFFAKFEKIQNGNIQNYISYGIIFLVLALIGVALLG